MGGCQIPQEAPRSVINCVGRGHTKGRLAKGISQEKLALMAEVDRSYLGRIERGDNNAALLTLVRIAGALEMTAAALLHRARV